MRHEDWQHGPFDEEEHHGWRDRDRWMAMAGAGRKHHGRRHRRDWYGPGFGGWGPGFPGPFFGRGPKVGRGDVRAAILVLLSEHPMHGYQVIQELTERSGGVWRPSPGSVYPTLQMLEDEGLVASEESDGRRVFRLTDAGQAEIAKRADGAAAPWERTGATGPLMDLREAGFGLVAAVWQVAHTGSERQVDRAKEVLTEARKNLYRLLADDDGGEGGSTDS